MKYYTSLMIFHTMKDLRQVVDAVKVVFLPQILLTCNEDNKFPDKSEKTDTMDNLYLYCCCSNFGADM